MIGSHCTLQIGDVFPEDEGEYSCVAVNSLGDVTTLCYVSVEGKDIMQWLPFDAVYVCVCGGYVAVVLMVLVVVVLMVMVVVVLMVVVVAVVMMVVVVMVFVLLL